MNIPATTPSHAQGSNRIKAAGLGFGITVAPLLALAGIQLLLATATVRRAGFDLTIDGWVVSQYRAVLMSFYAMVIAIMFAYWLLTATLSSWRFLKIKSANVALAFSGLTFVVAMVVASAVPMTGRLFKVICPGLGLPDTIPPLPAGIYSFDGETSCEAFSNGAAPVVLLGVPAVLLATSAILRIVLSRRLTRNGT